MDPETKAAFSSLAKLIEDTSQSLQDELAAFRAETATGLERVEAATRRNSTSLAGGAGPASVGRAA